MKLTHWLRRCFDIRGPLALEEERLYRLRQEREGEARKALQEERERLERESRETMVSCQHVTECTGFPRFSVCKYILCTRARARARVCVCVCMCVYVCVCVCVRVRAHT